MIFLLIQIASTLAVLGISTAVFLVIDRRENRKLDRYEADLDAYFMRAIQDMRARVEIAIMRQATERAINSHLIKPTTSGESEQQ